MAKIILFSLLCLITHSIYGEVLIDKSSSSLSKDDNVISVTTDRQVSLSGLLNDANLPDVIYLDIQSVMQSENFETEHVIIKTQSNTGQRTINLLSRSAPILPTNPQEGEQVIWKRTVIKNLNQVFEITTTWQFYQNDDGTGVWVKTVDEKFVRFTDKFNDPK